MKQPIQSIADRNRYNQRRHHFGAKPHCKAERIGSTRLLLARRFRPVQSGTTARGGKTLIETGPIIWSPSRIVAHYHPHARPEGRHG